ncbi:unnamed protein product, partial [Rotaria magnacalcarata]
GLKIISLESNAIGDNGARDLALALRNNKTLTTLDLTRNNIGIPGAEYFFESLQSSPVKVSLEENRDSCHLVEPTLKALHLGANHSDKPEVRILVDGLECNTIQTKLSEKDAHITRKLLNPKLIENSSRWKWDGRQSLKQQSILFFSTIANHPTLATLNMRQNLTSIDDLDHFGDILRNNMRLTTLCLEKNVIGNHGAETLASGLRDNMTLKTLILSSARIGVAGAKSLADAIQNNTTLTTFVLKHDQIGVQGTEYLANMLKINKTLVDIDLTNNQISNDGAKSIANALQNNTTLTVLNLSSNTILREGARYLANALEMNKTLKEMYVSSNQIGDDGLEYLRVSLEKNITLTKLHIGSNGITNTMYKEKLYYNNLRDLMFEASYIDMQK